MIQEYNEAIFVGEVIGLLLIIFGIMLIPILRKTEKS
jgi:hypothetical protein